MLRKRLLFQLLEVQDVDEEVEEDEVEDQALHQVHHLLQVAQARLQHQVLEIE